MNTRSYTWAARRRILMAAALSVLAGSAPALACTYCVKHAFAGSPNDGGGSTSSLIKVGTCYYGTTQSGGTYGYGTVFSLCGTTWTIMHDFAGGTTDGAHPHAGLAFDGTYLYGTTVEGGSGSPSNCADFPSCGTVYRLAPNGTGYSVLYSFQGVNTGTSTYDGYAPFAGLTYDPTNGFLYGTTTDGGNPSSACSTSYSHCGTVYQINPSSVTPETVLYSFSGLAANDGANPAAAPIMDTSGDLYGTTYEGGTAAANCTDFPHGCGTVWELPAGSATDSILWAFKGVISSDGAGPISALVNWQGGLWGTTFAGGTSTKGTVFEVTAPNVETNIHSFTGGADGGYPEAGLTIVANLNRLYGDTALGANASCAYYYTGGCGTIFRITGTGPFIFSTRYSFNNNHTPRDGGSPFDTLLLDGKYLWGTTLGGGALGNGTLFRYPLL